MYIIDRIRTFARANVFSVRRRRKTIDELVESRTGDKIDSYLCNST